MRIRTGYSFHNAFGHLDEVASRLTEIGWEWQPISDTNSTFGFNRWSKLVKKPIFGVELAVVKQFGERRPAIDWWTFFAVDNLQLLHDLIGISTNNKQREPALLYEDAINFPGNIIKIAGSRCLLDELKGRKSKDIFLGLSPSTPLGLYKEAKKKGLHFIATSDNFFTREEDKEIYRIALGRRASTQTYPQYILSDKEWNEALHFVSAEDRKKAIGNRNSLMKKCTAKLLKASIFVPPKPKTLYQMCLEGAKKKNCDLTNKVYSDRLKRELDLIKQKSFEDYFYIIADIISFAKTKMIVGPARGSSCGSLVCYLLDITSIDPIPFDLVFERFIDVNRADLPDIDIDFSDERRDVVFDYVVKKYGREHVARLGTTGMFRPKSAIVQIGKALRIPSWKLNKLSDSLIIRSSGDSRANQQLEDTIKETEAGRELLKEYPQILAGAKLESHPTNAGMHAAGLCVTKEPIDKYVAIDHRIWATMCDKKDAEDFNMLKIDMLGLTQLSVFERCLQLMGKKPINGFLETVPIDDPAAFDVLNERKFSGIFQFNGIAVQSLAKWIKFTTIEDYISITALARPGPMASGGATSWVKRKTGQHRIEYPHPILKPYLEKTLGIVTFQEQVLRIGREVGDLSWEDVTELRKAMSKSLGEEYFNKFGDRWKNSAIKKGISKDVADDFWSDLCAYGSWAFNRAHSVAYGLVSYWCCWLKAHYPLEFAAATLDAESLPQRQLQMLRELKEEGVNYIPVDPEKSEDKWTIDRKRNILLGPLTLIKGIGPAALNKILASRRSSLKTKLPLPAGIAKKLKDVVTDIDSLYPISDTTTKLAKLRNVKTRPTPIKDIQTGVKGEVLAMAVVTRIAPRDQNDAAKVAQRGYKVNGPTLALNMFMRDDTDEILCIIDRFKFSKLGKKITEEGRVGKSLYAIKGTVPKDFRMISVQAIRYLGEMEKDYTPERSEAYK